MKFLLINHHLFQEGDTYGLIYALQLNKALSVGDAEMYGLFYVNMYEYANNIDGYKDKIQRRMQYFSSFGLLGDRVKLVFCSYSDKVALFNFSVKPNYVHVVANEARFKRNPRLVSLFLTGAENDPSGALKKDSVKILQDLSTDEIIDREVAKLRKDTKGGDKLKKEDLEFEVARMLTAHYAKGFEQALSKALVPNFNKIKRRAPIELQFAYIAKSTSYVAQCIRERGFLEVSSVLRKLVLGTTKAYTRDNERFLNEFMTRLLGKYVDKRAKDHYAWHDFDGQDEQEFVVVLFWIRGAKKDEHEAIFVDGSKGSVGKPQHHTNLTLYKYVRFLVQHLSEQIKKPFLFVPIGDELKEITEDGKAFEYTKGQKAHNLINFFNSPTFKGKPMGAQMSFLLQLSSQYQVIQVGMRSGSMERLMYLGVPTIYFDRTEEIEDLPSPVGDARIRQLCGFQGTSQPELMDYFLQCTSFFSKTSELRSNGYPLFFHVENKDTGFLRYSDAEETRVKRTVGKLVEGLEGYDRERYNALKSNLLQKNYLRGLLSTYKNGFTGALTDRESEKFVFMLWYMSEVYPYYARLYRDGGGLAPKITFQENDFRDELDAFKLKKEEEEAQKRLDREERARRANEEVDTSGFFDMFNQDNQDSL